MENSTLKRILAEGNPSSVYARIVKGRSDAEFQKLSHDPGREVVLIMGVDGLEAISDLTDYEKLLYIGHKSEYLDSKLKAGYKYKLFSFTLKQNPPIATWENVLDCSHKLYPETSIFSRGVIPALKDLEISEVEKCLGYNLMGVEREGIKDERFITYERFKSEAPTLSRFRAFLYFTFHLKELYAGHGYTRTEDGRDIMKEYLLPNQPVTGLTNFQSHDLSPITN